MEKFFKLKENGTTVTTEFLAGLTTFFAMSYIIFVNPNILSKTGMPFQAVFLSTIIATVVSTLVMGLFANVPYALAPGMGLNAFFTFTATEAYKGGVFSVNSNGGIVPSLVNFTSPGALLAVIGLIITVFLLLKKVRGAILIGIVLTTLLAIPMGVVDLSKVSFESNSLGAAFNDLGTTFMAAFGWGYLWDF